MRLGAILLVALLLPVSAGGERRSAGSPPDAVTAFLREVYARDYGRAYAWIASEDRALKTREEYVREQGAFTGAALELARVLASLIRFENARTSIDGDRATVTFRVILPDANAPAVDALLLEFDEARLAALSPRERRKIASLLREMARTGELPVVVGENERWELVREGGGWRVWLNWAGARLVRFEAATKEGLPWVFEPVQPVVRAKPGETLRTSYRVKNLSDREITGKARHVLTPPEETGHVEIVTCFCFLQQTLEPGEEELLPVVFRVSYEIPDEVTDLRVRYEFYPLDKFPWKDARER